MTWSNNEFIYNINKEKIRENPGKRNIQRILTKNFKNNYRRVLERANVFFVMVDGKVFKALTGFFFHTKLHSDNRIILMIKVVGILSRSD